MILNKHKFSADEWEVLILDKSVKEVVAFLDWPPDGELRILEDYDHGDIIVEQRIYDEVELWLRAELKKMFDEELAAGPWWCPICGVGGNYEGARPDSYWFPPEDHICELKTPDLKGITNG